MTNFAIATCYTSNLKTMGDITSKNKQNYCEKYGYKCLVEVIDKWTLPKKIYFYKKKSIIFKLIVYLLNEVYPNYLF